MVIALILLILAVMAFGNALCWYFHERKHQAERDLAEKRWRRRWEP